MDSKSGVAVIFEGTEDLHYYANPEAAPAPGFELQVKAKSDHFKFGKAVFPKPGIFTDPLGTKVEVYAGNFKVFIPIESEETKGKGQVQVVLSGVACTSMVCLPPFEFTLETTIDLDQSTSMQKIVQPVVTQIIEPSTTEGSSYTILFALSLSLLAGLALNIMPCVWPVLPLIVMRIVKSAEEGKSRSIMMGLAFCLGILLFFGCLVGGNIILQSFYQTTFGWGDHLRNPFIVSLLAVTMIVMSLFMFGVFTFTVPSSVSGKSGPAGGYAGSIGMGFLAAVLSTPCSFGILGVAFVWALGQSLALGALAIMMIGVGMALPYAILTWMPGLLNRLPRSGQWMELFKQSLGFVLLIIAVKMIKAVPSDIKIELLYFCVVLSFCIWMWGCWVTYGSKLSHKLFIRGLAVLLTIVAFVFFFAPERIEWQDFDQQLIQTEQARNRPVLIKFTADWCTNCDIVDKVVYQRKDVAALIKQKNVLSIKADTTTIDKPATVALKNVYNEVGRSVPISVLLVPGEEKPKKWREIFFADKLLSELEKLDSTKSGDGQKKEN
ncbi:MAG: protein-disulfide reductase DsbD family protein [Planctomycetota bacterium]|jgi:thiol:disulfide interchange protein DsbD